MQKKDMNIEEIALAHSLTKDEFENIKKILGREPNYVEIGIFSAMWSEHCSYKSSKKYLSGFPTKAPWVIQGPGENAGVIDIGDGYAAVFKMESHNHPSFIEPYQGAATGVGGILRDVFTMGARPVASMNSIRFASIEGNSETAKKHRYLLKGVVAGIGGYGNCMGVPTIGGETSFEECYAGNNLVNAFTLGLAKADEIFYGRAEGIGNPVIYVGSKTGRDGLGGAVMSSASFTEDSESKRPTVQVGDPFTEKLLLEACLELFKADLIVGIQDMGAAGIVSSSCEMSSKANSGMELNLDMVPQREEGMSAYEIMLSESQERMLLCVKKGHENDVKKLFEDYNLEAVVIGRVTEGHDYILHHKGEVVTNIPVSTLTDDVLEEPSEERVPQRILDNKNKDTWVPQLSSAKETLEALLQQPTIASKKMFTETYDSQVRTSTVVGPGSDAGVIRIRGTKKALAMTTDGNGRFIYLNPEVGGKIAVLEAATNIISSGALPLAITDCLNYGDPNDPEIYWELHQSINGMAEACRTLDTPVISGNVSLYNENNGEAIYPTAMIGMVGLIKDVYRTVPSFVQNTGDKLYLVGKTGNDFNGSELQKLLNNKISGDLNDFDLEKVNSYLKNLLVTMEQGLVSSSHDLSEGGLGVSLAEMVFGTDKGIKVSLDMKKELLFSETPGRLVVSVSKDNVAAFEEIMGEDITEIGEVQVDHQLDITLTDDNFVAEVSELEKLWEEAIPCLMKSKD